MTDKNSRPEARVLTFVDLFAGVGGFTLGLLDDSQEKSAQFAPRLLVDIDSTARQVAVRNMPKVPYLAADMHHVSASQIREMASLRHDENVDVVIGGPPCQGFSFLGKRVIEDPRNILVMDFMRLVKELHPLVAVMENVPLVMTAHGGAVIREITEGFTVLGYSTCAGTLTANEYGVPQIRKRAFVLAYHADLKVAPTLPPRTHERLPSAMELVGEDCRRRFDESKLPYVSVQDAIGDLPSIKAGQGEEFMLYPKKEVLSPYQQWARTGSLAVFNHISRTHSKPFLDKIAVIKEGSRNMDLPAGKRFSDNYYSQAYARLHRNGIANTITTHFGNPGSGRFIHYQEVRSITVREGARLQSFPDRFVFGGELSAQMRHVGNAVPPLLARAIRDQIARDLTSGNPQPAIRVPIPCSPVRSRTMAAVPSKNTSVEIRLRQALRTAGLRGYRLHGPAALGNPDILFPRERVVVFVDGCFWHGCPRCYREPKTNKEYWQMKVQRNKSRADHVNQLCDKAGWHVIRIWEHDVTRSPRKAATMILKAVLARRPSKIVPQMRLRRQETNPVPSRDSVVALRGNAGSKRSRKKS